MLSSPSSCPVTHMSQYDMTFSGDFAATNAFPSPESRNADDGCDSAHEMLASGETETQPKNAAKRKRENRYKNAPPSVLSVRARAATCIVGNNHQSPC